MITVYGIPNCDTMKLARTWLSDQGLSYQFHDYKRAGVPPEQLQRWLKELGWEKILNRSGTTWRKLDDTTRAAVTDAASARALMLAQASVIKRPVVQWPDGRHTVGFSPERFGQLLA